MCIFRETSKFSQGSPRRCSTLPDHKVNCEPQKAPGDCGRWTTFTRRQTDPRGPTGACFLNALMSRGPMSVFIRDHFSHSTSGPQRRRQKRAVMKYFQYVFAVNWGKQETAHRTISQKCICTYRCIQIQRILKSCFNSYH